jgi:hypothetical protein
MDTSKEYVKMCDCSEIQDEWETSVGDFYALKDSPHTRMYWCEEIGSIKVASAVLKDRVLWHGGPFKDKDEVTWLPRQDQLQDMVRDKEIYIHKEPGMKWCLWLETDEMGPKEILYFETPEQLWLSIVMKERFNKTWNGEAWTSI